MNYDSWQCWFYSPNHLSFQTVTWPYRLCFWNLLTRVSMSGKGPKLAQQPSEDNGDAGDTDNTCVVCFKIAEIYSVGICDHPVCYECSTRMRVLCKQNECPICRQDMPKVSRNDIRGFSGGNYVMTTMLGWCD